MLEEAVSLYREDFVPVRKPLADTRPKHVRYADREIKFNLQEEITDQRRRQKHLHSVFASLLAAHTPPAVSLPEVG